MDKYLNLDAMDLVNPENALQYEWLETNGLGGYASSTPYACNTRKYHGLLAVPVEHMSERYMLLSVMLTKFRVKDKEIEFPTCRFPGVYHPTGHRFMESFSLANSYPEAVYKADTLEFTKSFLMLQDRNALLIRLDINKAEHKLTLEHRPLLAFRDIHSLQTQNMCIDTSVKKARGYFYVSPYESMPSLYFKCNIKTNVYPSPDWYLNIEYPKEHSRGYDYHEDLFCPAVIEHKAVKGDALMILVTTEQELVSSSSITLEDLWKEEIKYRKSQAKIVSKGISPQLVKSREFVTLKEQAYKFIIHSARAQSPSVIAGFPWFGEWGRDTMISLPGLTLYNNNAGLCLEVLKTYIAHSRDSLIPNQLNVNGTSSYNSIDASLFFFWVLLQYLEYYKYSESSIALLRKEFEEVIKTMIGDFKSSRVPHVRCMPSGYLQVGSRDTQLTWMDAKVYGEPVTPRHGYPVEINALWYNALKISTLICSERFQKDPDGREIQEMIKKIECSFEELYFCEEGYLYDSIYEDHSKANEIRPNQYLALGLPYQLITRANVKKIMDYTSGQLFVGLAVRTLSPLDGRYRGNYHGSQEERDGCYHQGSAWPFLLGWFTDAYIQAYSASKTKLAHLQDELLKMLQIQVPLRGIGGLSELHDGDIPHTSRGCPFQAWSVAETIRAIEKLQEKLS